MERTNDTRPEREDWEERFDREFKCPCMLCIEGEHEFTTTADHMKDFIRKELQRQKEDMLDPGAGWGSSIDNP